MKTLEFFETISHLKRKLVPSNILPFVNLKRGMRYSKASWNIKFSKSTFLLASKTLDQIIAQMCCKSILYWSPPRYFVPSSCHYWAQVFSPDYPWGCLSFVLTLPFLTSRHSSSVAHQYLIRVSLSPACEHLLIVLLILIVVLMQTSDTDAGIACLTWQWQCILYYFLQFLFPLV